LLSLAFNGRETFRSYHEAKFFNASLHQHQFKGEESASQTLRAELNKKASIEVRGMHTQRSGVNIALFREIIYMSFM